MRQKLLLLAAVFFGVLAFMFTYQQINQERQKILGMSKMVTVIRLTQAVSAEEKITVAMLSPKEVQRFTNDTASAEILYEHKDSIIGKPVRRTLAAGEILTWNDVVTDFSTGRTGLTSLTKTGFRSISIPVDTVSSVTGLVQPNNYVDIVGTFRFPDAKGDASLDTITLTILQRVRVVACGTDIGKPTPEGRRAGQRSSSYSTVTLELTPKEVEMIVFASQKGRLTLSLRGYEDLGFTYDLQSVDWAYLQKSIQQYTKDREKIFNPRLH